MRTSSSLSSSLPSRLVSAGLVLGLAIWTGFASGEQPQIIFSQPNIDSIEQKVFVPKADRRLAPEDVFAMVLWQPNPQREDGLFVPTKWEAGAKTGLYPSGNLADHQRAFRDAPGSTTVQAQGNAVGAYLNSADFPQGTRKYKLMITPHIKFNKKSQVRPFVSAGRAVQLSLDLQVPTAVDGHRRGSNTYVTADLLFVDQTTRNKISYGSVLFYNGNTPKRENIAFDEDSRSVMVNGPVAPQSKRLSMLAGSATATGAAWQGWRTFKVAITLEDFEETLAAVKERQPDKKFSADPKDYALAQFHLNAEMHFETAPAELGWSMKNAEISLIDTPPPLVH